MSASDKPKKEPRDEGTSEAVNSASISDFEDYGDGNMDLLNKLRNLKIENQA